MSAFPDSSVLFNAIKNQVDGGFLYIDPKADSSLLPAMLAINERSRIFVKEARRRGVRFLPTQVLRPLFAEAGLTVGRFYKDARGDDDFLTFPPLSSVQQPT